jgi:hypothetical protein
MHYRRWRLTRNPLSQPRGRWDGHEKVYRECSVDGCKTVVTKKRMCSKHVQRIHRHGSPDVVLPRGGLNKSSPEDFWSNLDKKTSYCKRLRSYCWEYAGSRSPQGYGQVMYQGRQYRAHQLAFLLDFGRLAEPMTLHRCDNPPCCRPSHLYEGDGSDNMNDMYSRGRGNRPLGVDHHMSKVDEKQRREIAARYLEIKNESSRRGLTRSGRKAVSALAEEFGISVDTVRRITSGLSGR